MACAAGVPFCSHTLHASAYFLRSWFLPPALTLLQGNACAIPAAFCVTILIAAASALLWLCLARVVSLVCRYSCHLLPSTFRLPFCFAAFLVPGAQFPERVSGALPRRTPGQVTRRGSALTLCARLRKVPSFYPTCLLPATAAPFPFLLSLPSFCLCLLQTPSLPWTAEGTAACVRLNDTGTGERRLGTHTQRR